MIAVHEAEAQYVIGRGIGRGIGIGTAIELLHIEIETETGIVIVIGMVINTFHLIEIVDMAAALGMKGECEEGGQLSSRTYTTGGDRISSIHFRKNLCLIRPAAGCMTTTYKNTPTHVAATTTNTPTTGINTAIAITAAIKTVDEPIMVFFSPFSSFFA